MRGERSRLNGNEIVRRRETKRRKKFFEGEGYDKTIKCLNFKPVA